MFGFFWWLLGVFSLYNIFTLTAFGKSMGCTMSGKLKYQDIIILIMFNSHFCGEFEILLWKDF